jgi:hypothetical protein
MESKERHQLFRRNAIKSLARHCEKQQWSGITKFPRSACPAITSIRWAASEKEKKKDKNGKQSEAKLNKTKENEKQKKKPKAKTKRKMKKKKKRNDISLAMAYHFSESLFIHQRVAKDPRKQTKYEVQRKSAAGRINRSEAGKRHNETKKGLEAAKKITQRPAEQREQRRRSNPDRNDGGDMHKARRWIQSRSADRP